MQTPIIRARTADGIELQGLNFKSLRPTSDKVVIHLHGIWGNFYENPFIDYFADFYPRQGYSFMTVNTRFHDGGSMTGRFETCMLDIPAWLDYAKLLGYQRVILQGHSLGTYQAVYYYYLTSLQPNHPIKALILLAPVDNVALYCTDDITLRQERIALAKDMARRDPATLIPRNLFDMWPLSAGTYLNFIDFDTNTDVFPFRSGSLAESPLSRIKLPVFASVGDNDFAAFPSANAMIDQLQQLEGGIEAVLIEGAPHNFALHEPALLDRIQQWLKHI